MTNSGSFRKYSLYAIGEILLVMIGILLALQVNNWNQERLERLEEIEILKSVKDDLNNTISEFTFLNGVRDRILAGTDGLLKMTRTNEIDESRVDSLLGLTFYRPTFNNELGSINFLFTSGKINLIENDSIRNFLIAWPGQVSDMTEEEVYAITFFQDRYYPKIAEHIMVHDVLVETNSTSFFGTEIFEGQFSDLAMEGDYESLFDDREFLNHLRMRASHLLITNAETMDLANRARWLIDMIDREIGK